MKGIVTLTVGLTGPEFDSLIDALSLAEVEFEDEYHTAAQRQTPHTGTRKIVNAWHEAQE